MSSLQVLEARIANSELGHEWINNLLMDKDVWSVKEIGYTEEELQITRIHNIYFQDFLLPWLKVLTKLTALASAREKCSLSRIQGRVNDLKKLDKFLISEGYNKPEMITDALLQKFINARCLRNRHATITYVVKLWAEEQWLRLSYTPRKYQRPTPKIEIIPEEVLYQIYETFDLFPMPLERLFRLQIILGCRIGELLKMPRQCLKKEGGEWFLLRWVQKRKHWRFYQIHPLVANLVQEQQKFLNTQFGSNSDFDKLFCKLSTTTSDGASHGGRFEVEPVYMQKPISGGIIHRWLRDFSEKANLQDKHGNKFNLQSHMFRRTKASIMAYCEVEDEYIAAVLGHGSLDMLPHYRKRSLERLEKEAKARGYVDMYGRVTSLKPRKRRYEKLADIIETKVSTALGECHRPMMLGDCQYRYACLSCGHHRVTKEDKPKIEADIQSLEEDLLQAQAAEHERRFTEINRLLTLLKTRLLGLEKLEKLQES